MFFIANDQAQVLKKEEKQMTGHQATIFQFAAFYFIPDLHLSF
jgi:hypothetical protein